MKLRSRFDVVAVTIAEPLCLTCCSVRTPLSAEPLMSLAPPMIVTAMVVTKRSSGSFWRHRASSGALGCGARQLIQVQTGFQALSLAQR